MLHLRLILAVLLALRAAAAAVRGVDPADAQHYVPDAHGMFHCRDGSGSIPFSQVNDNYCDCPGDGSDEPGTSACYHGKFYCANRGHQSQLLSTSFVDDGICDCCDGSDEQHVVCKNTCLDKGAEERQAVRDKVEQMRASLDKKQRLISEGRQRRAAWPGRSAVIDAEVAAQQKAIAELEAAKAEAKAAADADRKRIAEEREAELKATAEARQAAQAEQQQHATAQDATADDATAATDNAPSEKEETDEERGRRIASQWTHDPEAAGHPAEDDGVTEGGEGQEAEGEEELAEDLDSAERHDYDYEAHSSGHVDPDHVWSPLEDKVHEANRELEEARRQLEQLQQEQDVIQQYHASGARFDFGPDDMFAGLAGRCLADTGTRWTYEACFFDKATQKEPHNPSNRVSLGTWSGWANDYTEAVFAGGDPCGGAPARSLRVRLVCGEEERMWGGEEPATCVYTVWMSSPLACRQSDLQQELDRLAELERFEAEVRAEIEAAEKARKAAGGSDHSEL